MADRSGHMLAYPLEQKRCDRLGWPLIVQPKYDGDRMSEDIIRPDLRFLISASELRVYSCPHIEEACNKLNFTYPMDGEFYRHGWEHPEIDSAFSRGPDNIHPLIQECSFHVFDIKDESLPQFKRLRIMNEIKEQVRSLGLGDVIKIAPSYVVNSWAEIHHAYDKFREQGYEGIIVRHPAGLYTTKRNVAMQKFKPKKQDYYKILNVHEAESRDGMPLSMVGSFDVCGKDGNSFNVGAGHLTHPERKAYWAQHMGGEFLSWYQWIYVGYQNLTPKGIPRSGLCIKCLNISEVPEHERF